MLKDKALQIILFYLLALAVVFYAIVRIAFPDILSGQNLLHWDAQHYYWIKNNGYKDFRVAFFPLFPLLWKITSLGVYGICALNTLIFLSSFYLLMRLIKANTLQTLLYLSIPSIFFLFLPFSESVFFASSTLLLFGLKKGNNLFVLTGLLLSSLARPAFTIFIPALILAELLCGPINKKALFKIGSYLFVTIAGVLIVGIIQHHYTGEWFKFFSVQKGWGNKLQIPQLPFNSWGGDTISRLDGTALFFGIISGIVLLLYMLKAKPVKLVNIPKEVAFSLAYLAGISLSVLLFRGGVLFSLNRFVYATPFIMVAFNYYLKQNIVFSTKVIIIAFFIMLVYWLLFGSYVHIQAFISYFLVSGYLLLTITLKTSKAMLNRVSFIALILINFIFQFVFLFKILNGDWVG